MGRAGQGIWAASIAQAKVLGMEILDVFKKESCLALLGSSMLGKPWWKVARLRESGFRRPLKLVGNLLPAGASGHWLI